MCCELGQCGKEGTRTGAGQIARQQEGEKEEEEGRMSHERIGGLARIWVALQLATPLPFESIS